MMPTDQTGNSRFQAFGDRLVRFRGIYRDDPVFSVLMMAVIVVPLVFSLWTAENFEMIKFPVLLATIGVAAILFFVARPMSLRYNRVTTGLLIALMIWASLATIISLDPVNSFFGLYLRLTGSWITFFALAVFTILLIHVLDRNKFELVLNVLIASSLAMGIISLLQNAGIAYYPGLVSTEVPRVPGLLGNPNFTSMFLVSMLPCMVLAAVQYRASRYVKYYYGLAALIVLCSVVIMSSRGALLGLAASLGTVAILAIYMKFSRRFIWYFALFGTAAALLFGIYFVAGRSDYLATSVNLSDENISFRLQVWSVAVSEIHHWPWFGSGLANFHLVFEQFRGPESAAINGSFDDAHNVFLQLGATGGIPLVFCFTALMGYAVFAGLRRLRTDKDWLTLSCIGGIAGFVVAGSFTPVAIPCYLLLFICIAGLVFQEVRTLEFHPGAWGLRAAGIVAGAALIVYAVCFLSGEIFYFYGQQDYFSNRMAAAYRKFSIATRLNPFSSRFRIYKTGSEIRIKSGLDQVPAEIEKIRNLHPRDGLTYRETGGLYFLLYNSTNRDSDLEVAISDIKHSMGLNKYFTERYQYLSYITFVTGRYDETEEYLRRALILNPKDIQSWLLLAKIYQIKDERLACILALEKSQSLQPSGQLRVVIERAKAEPDIQAVSIAINIHDPGNLE